jgi:hypothetical protein
MISAIRSAKYISLFCLLGPSAVLEAAPLSAPSDLAAGSSFRFIFLTSGTTTATSTDISDYNTFVQTQASGATYQGATINWNAIGSTTTVNARDNVGGYGTTVPIYLVTGISIASNLTTSLGGLWSGTISSAANVGINGLTISSDPTLAWTGSYSNGLKYDAVGNVQTLGSPNTVQGSISSTDSTWLASGVNANSNSRRMFALSDILYVIISPSSTDTQSSLNTLSKSLRSSFNATVMSSNYANMNTYDCNLFDQNNMCISAGGRYTNIDNPSSNHSAAVVVLGHKISPHIRIGGFLDQSVNHNMPSGVDMSNKNPMMGAFAVWNHQADGLGFQMKLANAYLDKDLTTSRAVIGTSEAGRGRTDLNTQSYVGELSYAFQYQDLTIVRPYFALRYTNIKQDGYTEDTTASVTAPLTYAKLSDRSTTALMGVKLNHALTPRTNLTASLGVEQDINHKTDQLTASGVADLTSENFNNNIKRTRPVASAGAYYAVAKNQRLSGEVYYQQLPFQSTGSATAYFNYMIGF